MNGVDFPEPRRQTVLEAAEAPENDPAVSQAGVSRKTMDSTDVQSGPTQTKGMAEMCERKYELTDETKTLSDGTVLHRIRAVRDFGSKELTKIHTGDLGGWVDGEDRLSHEGNAWIYDDAQAYGDSKVLGDAHVFGNAKVYDHARVYGCATVGGTACVCGEARICGDAVVSDSHDYTVFKNVWSSGRWFTYTRSDKMWTVGCFHGTGDTLIAKAYKDSELSGQCYEAIVRAQEAIDKSKELSKCTPDGDVKSHGSVN